MDNAPTREIGYAQTPLMSVGGHNIQWWMYDDETTPELRWPQSIWVFDQMRRTDAQVKSVLRAVTLPVCRTPWRIDPAGARPEVVQLVAEDLGLPIVGEELKQLPRARDRFSWLEHLREALLMLPFGHMYFEQNVRIVDGKARLRKLAARMPKTIEEIDVARDGGLVSITQYGLGGGDKQPSIPVSRLVAYVHEKEAGNWLGHSLLRPAYKNWLLKDRLLRVWAQTIERNGMGIPVYTAAPTEKDLATGLGLATTLRSGEAAGAAIPAEAILKLMGVEGQLPDAEPAVRYHDEQLARAVLAHFLNLGTQTGSWALGSTFADFFTLSLQTLARQIADVATQHVVEDLVDWNWGENEPAPKIVFDEIGSRQAATAEAIGLLIDKGVLTADDVLETSLRQQYGLPPADPDTARTPPAQQSPAPRTAPETQPDERPGSVAASSGDAGPKEVTAHLPGKHPQESHGRRGANALSRARNLLAGGQLDVAALAAAVRRGDAAVNKGGYEGRGADRALAAIARKQGFGRQPKIVPSRQLDQQIADGDVELFRRVTPFGGKSAAEMAEQFRSGPVWYGQGEFGSGIYATTDGERVAKYGPAEGSLRMALRADARTVTVAQLEKIRHDRGVSSQWPKDDTLVFENLGRLAAALGYDAIAPEAGDERSPWIILNRGAVSVESAPVKASAEVTAKYNPGQLRDPGGEDGGQWVKAPGGGGIDVVPGDKLKLAGRIDLKPGEKLLSSQRIRTKADADGWDLMIAEVDTPGGRQARLGIIYPDDSQHWAAGPDPKRSKRIAELDAEIERLEEADLTDDLADEESDRLEELRSELSGLQDFDAGNLNRTAILTPSDVGLMRADIESGIERAKTWSKAWKKLANEEDDVRFDYDMDAEEQEERLTRIQERFDALGDNDQYFLEGSVSGGPEGDLHYLVGGTDDGEGGWKIELGIKPPTAGDDWYIGNDADQARFEGGDVKKLLNALAELSGDLPKPVAGRSAKSGRWVQAHLPGLNPARPVIAHRPGGIPHDQSRHGRRFSVPGDPSSGLRPNRAQREATQRAQELGELRQSLNRAAAAFAARSDRQAGAGAKSTSTPTRMTQGAYTKILKAELVRLHMLDGKTEKEAKALARPQASIDDLKARNTELRKALRRKGVDYRTEEQKRADDTEKNTLLDEVQQLAVAGGHDGAAKRAAASKMSKTELRKFVADVKDYQRRQKAQREAPSRAAFQAVEDNSLATPRQVGYIVALLRERAKSGEGGGFMVGPTETAEIRKMSKRDASAYINSLRGDY